MPLLAFSLFLTTALLAQTSPIVLPSEIDTVASTWVVHLKAGGREGDFTVNLSSRRSAVSRAWFGKDADDKALELTSGDHKVGRASLLVDALPSDQGKGSAGVIGQDVLGAYALGFDGKAMTLTLWKGGLTKDGASAWLARPVVRTPLKILPNADLLVGATLHGKPVDLMLRPGLGVPLLLTSLGTGGDLPVDSYDLTVSGQTRKGSRYVTDALRIGDVPVPFAQYARIEAMLPGYEGADGLIPVFLDSAERSLVDLPSKSFWIARRSEDETLTRVLTDLLRLPVRVEGTTLLVGEVATAPEYTPLSPYANHPIVQIGDQKSEDLLAGLRGPDRLAAIVALAKVGGARYQALVKMDGGTTVPINVEAPG